MQQVNLYVEAFRPRRDPLSIPVMIAAVVAVMVLGGCYTGYLVWRSAEVTRSQLTAESRKQALVTEIDNMRAQLEARARDTRLQSDNNRLRLQMQNTEALLAALESGLKADGGAMSYSELMVALARHRQEPLWLQRIRIQQGGERLIFSGATLQPDLLPAYLQALGDEPALRGRAFNMLTLKPEQESASARLFEVDTYVETPEPEGRASRPVANSRELSQPVVSAGGKQP
ncbi:conserved hypothetical protein [Hahella chejuensis KCTC 2396]|uniref:Tfp pilus assembly protein PilN n=1 Tax=Hahella chejuensis (strain KCTC 2396) TaxID=349521 RepID=Q2S972_HAHCH|nr:hypothetical protein [Hahella chejuensis]ABC32802.1 conserved hypothetical protein [Hahella chejuensis KCTC 2396]